MSVWNAVLQASHSALIDTLNVRFPADKLELGLPKRFDKWATTEGTDSVLLHEIQTAEGVGILALATRMEDTKIGNEIFRETILRAEKEFKLRNIGATFGIRREEAPELRMTIWLPIKVLQTPPFPIFDLAVGV